MREKVPIEKAEARKLTVETSPIHEIARGTIDVGKVKLDGPVDYGIRSRALPLHFYCLFGKVRIRRSLQNRASPRRSLWGYLLRRRIRIVSEEEGTDSGEEESGDELSEDKASRDDEDGENNEDEEDALSKDEDEYGDAVPANTEEEIKVK
ncbi:hypothetical protein U1Q18_022549 [Sarracenia purpurea var. burkii]